MVIQDRRWTGGLILVLMAIQLYQHPGMDIHAALDGAITVVTALLALQTMPKGMDATPAPKPTEADKPKGPPVS